MPDVTPSQVAPATATPVEMISALLDAERVIPDEKPAPEPVEAKPEEEAYEPAQNAEVEGADAPAEEPPQTAEIPLDQLEAIELEVTVQGEKKKVPIKALREGYMRQEDYSKKTADVARQREEAGKEARQAIETERSSHIEQLNNLQALVIDSVAPELKNADWNKLAKDDPFEYVRLRNQAEQLQKTLSTIKAKKDELEAKQNADKSQLLQKKAQETWQKLEADIPGFNKDLYQSLLKTGVELGIDEVNNWVDAGQIKLLHKAYLYDQLKVGKPAEDKKVAIPPKAIKPGAATSVPKQVQRQGKALDNLKKTGSVDALTQYLSASMK